MPPESKDNEPTAHDVKNAARARTVWNTRKLTSHYEPKNDWERALETLHTARNTRKVTTHRSEHEEGKYALRARENDGERAMERRLENSTSL